MALEALGIGRTFVSEFRGIGQMSGLWYHGSLKRHVRYRKGDNRDLKLIRPNYRNIPKKSIINYDV